MTATSPVSAFTSARLRRFEADAATDPDTALAGLVADLRAAGGPLVERVSPEEVDVTFVHVADAGSVALRTTLLRLPSHEEHAPLRRIEGTDVWHLTVRAASDTAVAYSFLHDPPPVFASPAEALAVYSDERRAGEHLLARETATTADPHNPIRAPRELVIGDEEVFDSVLVLPDSPYVHLAADGPTPALDEHELDGRRISVYQPDGTAPGDALPLVVVLDGEVGIRGGVHRRLDAAIAAGELPPLRAVFWHNRTLTSRMGELSCNPALADALADELIPFLAERYGVPGDASRRVIAGFSLGGLATAHIALTRPDAFGAALPMSGALWYTPAPGDEPSGWLIRQYEREPTRPTAVYLTVGQLEDVPVDYPGVAAGTTWVGSTRQFRDTLRDKGYDLRGYREVPSGHELVNLHLAVVDGLAALLR
ncbi:alpha/beta hydrolase-fold protein [Saccharothrix coeruleofusca]|uniref:Enterochelin esterase n=1 Tax=Saccharothrix coeruleofusca TaxID=33919 RepID=A0A918EIP0_9PSEU|nr:alpha/beta hydrolase-fold protein [Saccharothrix coeruleofusca]GGP85779.1 enterochelin esterase [Saccharothrix coeruleofusca]